MDVGMLLQLSAPGMQDPEKAGQIPANVFGIGGQFFDGIGGSAKQDLIA